MKKIMSAIIITIMALSVFVGAAARPDLQKGFSGDALEDAEVIAFITELMPLFVFIGAVKYISACIRNKYKYGVVPRNIIDI